MEWIGIVLLAVILAVLLVLLLRKPVGTNEETVRYLKEEKLRLEDELNDLRERFNLEHSEVVRTEGLLLSEREKFIDQHQRIEELQQKFTLEFSLVANKLLEDKTAKFTAQNQRNLDAIINPLKENIRSFEEKVEKVYKSESDERNILKGVISELMNQSKQIQEDANNLTKALKGDNKKQGNWGEMILERILERSGLLKDREYRMQTSLTAPAGTRFQPDVIIDLPDNKHIVIDAKVSLIAYEKMTSAELDLDRELHLKQHLLSIKTHIQGLSDKNYHDLYQINSPDFVMLFMPIESSFGIAVQQDAELFNYAWDRKVVIVSPSTLLASLRTISSIWKQERQSRNVLEIARLGGQMYDKFVGFLQDMEHIGRNIRQSQDAYDKALNKLSTGAGNLTNTSEKIKKLGARATKQIDTKFLDPDDLTVNLD